VLGIKLVCYSASETHQSRVLRWKQFVWRGFVWKRNAHTVRAGSLRSPKTQVPPRALCKRLLMLWQARPHRKPLLTPVLCNTANDIGETRRVDSLFLTISGIPLRKFQDIAFSIVTLTTAASTQHLRKGDGRWQHTAPGRGSTLPGRLRAV